MDPRDPRQVDDTPAAPVNESDILQASEEDAPPTDLGVTIAENLEVGESM